MWKRMGLILMSVLLLCALTGCGDRNEGNYHVINKKLMSQSYGIGFRKGDDQVCQQVGAALKVLAAEGRLDELSARYLGGAKLTTQADVNALDGMDVSAQTLIVGFTVGSPPLAYQDSGGTLTGFDVDLARAICDKLGWTADLRAMEYDPEVELDSGNVDCAMGGFALATGAEKVFSCTEGYLEYDQVLVTKNGAGYRSFGSLKKQKIGYPEGYGANAVLKATEPVLPDDAEMMSYVSPAACYAALYAGEVQGILISSVIAAWAW